MNKKKIIVFSILLFVILTIAIPITKSIYRSVLSTNILLDVNNSTYTIVFNGNGEDSGTTASKECEYTVNCTLNPNGFEKVGYTFDGWSTTVNGTKEYDDEETVLNLILTGNYNLYARWVANELVFENQTITKTYNSTNSQTASITGASNGTGSYTYTEKSEKNSSNVDTNYISISGTTITIAANTPAGTYTYVITATDNNSLVTKDAVYTITINKLTPTITLTEKTGNVYTGSPIEANTATVVPNVGGEVTYTYYTDSSCTTMVNTRVYAENLSYSNANSPLITCTGNNANAQCAIDWLADYLGDTSGSTSNPTQNNEQQNTNIPINVGNYYVQASTEAFGNYNAATSACVAHTITKSNTTTTLTNQTKTYTGTNVVVDSATSTLTSNNSTITNGTYTYAYYNGDSCQGIQLASAPINPGTYSMRATLTATNNYNSSTSSCQTLTISKATPTVTLTEKTGNVYTGSPIEGNTATVTLNGNDTYNGTIIYTYYTNSSCTAGATTTAPTNVGNYYVQASIEAFGNYNAATSSCVTHTITKSNTTTTLANQTIEYTGTNVVVDSATSTLNSNNSTITNGTYTYAYYNGNGCQGIQLASTPINPGAYSMTATLTATNNYNSSTSSCATLTINKLTPTVTLTEKTGNVYTGSPIEGNTATVTLNGNDTYSGTIIYTYYTNSSCTAGATTTAPTNVGNYYVQASIEAFGNYNAATSSCVAHTITKSNTTTTLTNQTIECTGTNVIPDNATSTLTSNNSTITDGTYTYTYYNGNSCQGIQLASAPINPGTYSMTATLTATNNYNSSTSSCATLTIETIDAIITINKGGVAWNNSGVNVALYQNGSVVYPYSSATVSGSSVIFEEIDLGTYDIYISQDESNLTTLMDSGLDIEAPGNTSETINYYLVTFNANEGEYLDHSTTNTVTYYIKNNQITRYSHTANINDSGVASSVYANYLSVNDVVTIPGAASLNIEVWFTTESASYDWLAIYPKGVTPTSSNYSSATISNGKLAGHGSYTGYTKPNDSDTTYHKTYTVNDDTVQFYFRSDSSGTAYYGYYAIITSGDIVFERHSGTYEEPTKGIYKFNGWNTSSDGNGTEYSNESSLGTLENYNVTLYAQYRLPTATFTTGELFNVALKVASGQSSATYSTSNSTITSFTKYNGTPTQEILNNATIVSSNDSEAPIYIWYENGTIYWYTIAETIYFNPTSSYMFYRLTGITTLDLSAFDLSKVTNSSNMFGSTTNLTTLVTPKVNSSSSISIGKTLINSSNTTYSSITSSMTPMTTLKVPYVITFNPNGGIISSSCTASTKNIYPGNPVGTMPSMTITRVGYVVDGWYTEPNGGTQVTESTIPPSSITYYAKWVKDPNAVFSEDIRNNNTYANANCESIQCMLEYFTQFREKRVDINGN